MVLLSQAPWSSPKLTSKEEDARYCQTCGHSPCFAIAGVGERAPALIPTGSADETLSVWILDSELELNMDDVVGD